MNDEGTEKSYSKAQQGVIKRNKHLPDELPIKQFVVRNSVLTDLHQQNKHVQAINHVFVMILVGQFFHSAVTDILYKGRLNLGVELIQRSFYNLHWIIVIWLCMFSSTVSVFFAFKIWAVARARLSPKSILLQTWDRTWLIIVIAYYIGFLYWPAVAMNAYDLRPAAKFGFTCEILRLVMKAHAFVRSNAPKILEQGGTPNKKQLDCPEFSKFMYFLWAPTLLYREMYPRTASIRWGIVFNHLLQFIAVIFFGSFIFQKYYIDVYKNCGREPFIWQDFMVIIFANTPAAMGTILALFFIIQHAWMNICAELFTFADRLFYQDWWTATTYKDYFRKWNVLVQDWLYAYIYKDLYEIVLPKNKTAANYIIFFISAVAHEYITALTFGVFMPILFILFFCFGAQFVHIEFKNKTVGSVFVFYSYALGISMISAAFAIEYFYRENCPEDDASFKSYIIPRFFRCKI